MHSNDEVQTGKDRCEAGDHDAGGRSHDMRCQILRTERSVKRPTGIDTAADDGGESEYGSNDEYVPAGEIDLGKGQIPRADHNRQHEISQCRWDGGHQEEEDHYDAMQREQIAVSVRLAQVSGSRKQFQPDPRRHGAAEETEYCNSNEVQDAGAFVIP